MIWLAISAGLVLFCFSIVLLVGAPYLPTLSPQVRAALKLADLREGQTLLELGCGDGKVLLAAARQGSKAIGYELNPIMALVAWARTRRYRHLVRVVWGDFWRRPWPEADVIFVFLHTRFMRRLDNKITRSKHRPVKLVSFAFQIPDKPAAAEHQGVYLYKY